MVEREEEVFEDFRGRCEEDCWGATVECGGCVETLLPEVEFATVGFDDETGTCEFREDSGLVLLAWRAMSVVPSAKRAPLRVEDGDARPVSAVLNDCASGVVLFRTYPTGSCARA